MDGLAHSLWAAVAREQDRSELSIELGFGPLSATWHYRRYLECGDPQPRPLDAKGVRGGMMRVAQR
jgi:hypothetical protein